MATTFGIIYATGSKQIRRIIVPDVDQALLDGTHTTLPGETLLIGTGSSDLDSCNTLVLKATGVAPPDLHCAIVDNKNIVVSVLKADPDLDSIPGATLIACYSPKIAVGCIYNTITKLFSSADPIPIPILRPLP